MRSFKGNIGLINKYTSSVLNNWLIKNNYLMMNYILETLGQCLSYIDDKSLLIEEFINS